MQNVGKLNSQGSILILCMWILLMLSIFSLSVGYSVRQKIKVVERLENRQELRHIAEAGIKKASYILKQDRNDYDSLTESWNENVVEFKDVKLGEGQFSIVRENAEAFRYGIADEESKININLVKSPLVFKRLFHDGLGLNETLSKELSESILDWRDEDDNPYESGAERQYYQALMHPYGPKNADFSVLQELMFVKGITPDIYKTITPYLSIDNSGKINLNTALVPVLRAMGFSQSLASKLMLYRMGLDRIDGTNDDNFLDGSADIVTVVNEFTPLTEEEKNNLKDFVESGLFTLKSSHFKIISQAGIGHRLSKLSVTCVVERRDANMEILSWQESYTTA